MKLSVFDAKGDIIYCDSLDINNNNQWVKSHLQFVADKAKFFYIGIYVESLRRHEEPPVQSIWIDKVSVNIDGFDMENFDLDLLPSLPPHDSTNLIPLLFEQKNTFSQIKELKSHRIVALGESMHNTYEFNKTAIRIIENQIINNNCRLVALEIPIDMGLKWNMFVQQKVSFDISEIECDLLSLSLPKEEWMSFLIWLKEYNEKSSRKVRLFGMDAVVSVADCLPVYFNEYITMDSLLFAPLFIDAFSAETSKLMRKIRRNENKIASYIGEKELSFLIRGLENTNNGIFGTDNQRFIILNRDAIMFNNLKSVIETDLKDDETVTIYAHLFHAGKKNVNINQLISPLGKQLYNLYGENYFCIGLFTYKDEIGTSPFYSIEDYCEQTGFSYFYTLSNTIPPCIRGRIRGQDFEGSRKNFNFDFMPLQQMIDALIFVDKVNTVDIDTKRKDRNKMEGKRIIQNLNRKNELMGKKQLKK
ncbi:hypothetical protein FACS1894160_3170 [Bacteroidia bacterium]|nr:hypothetical protein FACS1894123_05380 [Bacteroidia bacterium]GHV08604.1 hypothetical protein FACS1894160_3170 [Bacteroidia bacterium]